MVMCPPGSELELACEAHGVPTSAVRMRSELDLAAALRLSRSLRRFRADIVHFHTARAHTLGLIASRIAGTPVKVLSRRVDFDVGHNAFSKIKYRASVDSVIAITEAVRDVLVRGGVDPERVSVIYSGIDPGEYEERADGSALRRELDIRDSAPLVGAIGALAPHKAQDHFLKAAKKLSQEMPEVRYIIVGEGELERSLKALARSLQLDDIVTFTGFRRDIKAVLAAIDVFVLSSVAEGLCTSILDAMACGVPVVATRVGGVPEIVVDGECGSLVRAADPGELAAAIARVLRDPGMRERFAAAGRERVKSFTVEKTVNETEKLYRRLLQSKKGECN